MRFGEKSIGHGNLPTGLRNLFKTFGLGSKSLPRIPFSLTGNPNLRLACGVLRGVPTNTPNASIPWSWITVGGHNFTYFDTLITTDISDHIIVSHPKGKVISYITTPDEAYASATMFIGATRGIDLVADKIGMFVDIGTHAGTMVGNTTGWTLSNMSGFNIVTNTVNEITFNPPKPYGNTGTNGQNLNYWAGATARYVGTNEGLSIKKILFYRGLYDASSNTYPSNNGSGISGAILKGDVFYLSKSGSLNSVLRSIGDSLTALVDSPGQTNGNWQINTGGGPIFGYQLITDSTGIPVVTNSSADRIEIDTTTPDFIRFPVNTNDNNGFPGTGGHQVNSNIWVIAIIDISES